MSDNTERTCFLQGTVEEKVFQRQVTKQGLSGVVVDARAAASGATPTFCPEELKVLSPSTFN